jgi:hypothetical protein
MKLLDIAAMPAFDPKVPNGATSVSDGLVFFGRNANQGGMDTVSCVEHGAILCVSRLNEGGKLWRCPACNDGAYAP